MKLENIGSMRTIGAFMAYILFAFCVISYEVANDFKELPNSYLVIIGMIIGFYFAKDTIRNIKIGSKDNATASAIDDRK